MINTRKAIQNLTKELSQNNNMTYIGTTSK